jgi:AraC family transcriptional regulator
VGGEARALYLDPANVTGNHKMLAPQIIEKPPLRVIGIEAPFVSVLSPDATNFQVIGPLWDKFLHRTKQIPNRVGHAMFGIIYGRPESERTHPHELQYLASVPVSATSTVPDGMVSHNVPAGTFAVFTHRGPIAKIGETVRDIYHAWLPQSGYVHAGIADVELYDERFRMNSEDSEMEIWLSIRRAS